ncbi:MAG TPA: hypothetical protein VK107_06135 [Alloiococcus sp.]|nr:hypothetical protein [Alloiococcus sp.]
MKEKDKKSTQLFEVWGDIISIKPLLISLFSSVIFGLAFFILAPDDDSIRLMVGIAGIVMATIINSLIFKTKRDIQVTTIPKEETN